MVYQRRLCWRHVNLLNASDVERHGTQHDFGPHAFDSCSHSQVHFATEGEMRG